MTREEVIAVLDRQEEGWELKDAKLLASPYAEDAVLESPVSGQTIGRQEVQDSYQRLLDAWSPLDYTRENVLLDGDRLVYCFTVRGTHSGEFFRMAPTGKRFTFHGVSLVTLAHGEFVHVRRVYDFTGLLVKLGVLKAGFTH